MGDPITLGESEKSDSFTFLTNIIYLSSFQPLCNVSLLCVYFVSLTNLLAIVKMYILHIVPYLKSNTLLIRHML